MLLFNESDCSLETVKVFSLGMWVLGLGVGVKGKFLGLDDGAEC